MTNNPNIIAANSSTGNSPEELNRDTWTCDVLPLLECYGWTERGNGKLGGDRNSISFQSEDFVEVGALVAGFSASLIFLLSPLNI